MCGDTKAQDNISATQQEQFGNLNNAYNTAFGQNQAITGALTKSFSPILAAGPNQQGFSQGEMTARNTQVGENVGSSYDSAARATAEGLAARGGGNNMLPSGVGAQIQAQVNQGGAAALAAGRNQNLLDSYSAGRSNYWNAATALGGVASDLNPNAYAGAATSSGSAAAEEANAIQQAQMSPWTTAMGGLTALGGAAATAYAGR